MKVWILSSSLLILIIIGLRSLLKGRISFRVQYAVWLIVLLRLLIPFSIGRSPVSVESVMPTVAPVAQPLQRIESDYQSPAEESPVFPLEKAEPQTIPAATVISQPINLESLLQTVWMIGIGVIILFAVISNLLFQRKLRRSRIAFSGCESSLPVFLVHWLNTPCLAGLFRPSIYLTEAAAASPVCLHHVLEHEETHYRHGDHFWAWLRLAALALHWYNPLVWAAAILSRRDAELACDEAVLHRLGDSERRAYGETLLSLSIPHVFKPLSLSTSMSESKNSLRERIVFISHSPHMKPSVLLVMILLCLAAVGITFPGSAKASFSGDSIQDTFQSEDGSVTVYLELLKKESFFPEAASVFHLKNHEITTDETTRIVSALFGEDAPIYQVTQEQLDAMSWDAYGTQEDFDRWLAYAKWLQASDYPAIASGDDTARLESVNSRLSDFIEKYDHTEFYESMPHDDDRQLLYWDGSSQTALAEKDGVPYYITFYVQTVPDPAEYHLYISPLDTNIYALYPYPLLLDYGSDTITENQIKAAEQNAKEYISKMGLDGWEIRSSYAYPHTSNALTRFTIRIELEHQYDSSLKRCDSPVFLENPVDQISFEFSSDGRLYRMEYICPFDVDYVSDTEIISYEEAVQAVKAHCAVSTSTQFGTAGYLNEESGERTELVTQAILSITDLQPCLDYIGQKIPYHEEESYSPTLIPAVAVYGTTTLMDQNGDEITIQSVKDASWSVLHDDARPLFILSGLDGSLLENFLGPLSDTEFLIP